MHKPRVVGNRIKRSELFFIVLVASSVRILVVNQIEFLKEKHTRIACKYERDEHTVRVRFFTGLNTQYTNAQYYKEAVVKAIEINLLYFEIRKETVYKQSYKGYMLVVYPILSKREEIDFKLRSIVVGNRKHGWYESCKGTYLNNRIGYLHLNKMTNVKVKFDIL